MVVKHFVELPAGRVLSIGAATLGNSLSYLEAKTHRALVESHDGRALLSTLREMPDASFDLVIHDHLLPRPKVASGLFVKELNRVLAPEGHLFFTLPIKDGKAPRHDTTANRQREDDKPPRAFSSQGLVETLGRHYPLSEPCRAAQVIGSKKLYTACIAPVTWFQYSPHTPFAFRKTESGFEALY